MAIQQFSINQLSSEEDRKKLLGVIRECSDALTRVSAERDFIREEVKEISKQLDIPKRLVNKMIKVYHKQNFDEEVAVQDQFETLYETVVK
jgi:aspartokinase